MLVIPELKTVLKIGPAFSVPAEIRLMLDGEPQFVPLPPIVRLPDTLSILSVVNLLMGLGRIVKLLNRLVSNVTVPAPSELSRDSTLSFSVIPAALEISTLCPKICPLTTLPVAAAPFISVNAVLALAEMYTSPFPLPIAPLASMLPFTVIVPLETNFIAPPAPPVDVAEMPPPVTRRLPPAMSVVEPPLPLPLGVLLITPEATVRVPPVAMLTMPPLPFEKLANAFGSMVATVPLPAVELTASACVPVMSTLIIPALPVPIEPPFAFN